MNKDVSTQKNDTVCKKGIEMNEYEAVGFKMKYTGEVVVLPLEYESRRNKKIETLEKKVNDLQEESKRWEQRARTERAKLEETKKISEKLKNENEKLLDMVAQLQEKLNKFNSKGRASNTKLTPEVKQYIQQAYMQGFSVVKIFNELVSNNWDISYETVRRYVSSFKNPKN